MCVCRYESKFIESIVKEIADKLNLSLPHGPPSARPLSSALRPPSYFIGLLREWRRSVFQTPSLYIFFFVFLRLGLGPNLRKTKKIKREGGRWVKQKCQTIGTKHVDIWGRKAEKNGPTAHRLCQSIDGWIN